MPEPIVLGLADIQRLGSIRTFDPVRGWTTETIFEGTTAAVEAGQQSLIGFGVWHQADYSNPPKARLTVRTPDQGDGTKPANGILSTTYDLDGNHGAKSILEHPLAVALSDLEIDSIRRAFELKQKVAEVDHKDGTAKYSGPQTDTGKLLLEMLKRSQDSFLIGQFVFKLTHVIAADSEINIAYSNTSTIYNNAALINETQPTALYSTAIANAYTTVLNDYYRGTIPVNTSLGWLKVPPNITHIAGNKCHVTIEYWLEAWTTVFYPVTNL